MYLPYDFLSTQGILLLLCRHLIYHLHILWKFHYSIHAYVRLQYQTKPQNYHWVLYEQLKAHHCHRNKNPLRLKEYFEQNKTENLFSLKDDEREMTMKTKPMFTRKLTNHHDNFDNHTKGLWHPLITILTIPIDNFDNPYMLSIQSLNIINLTLPTDNFYNPKWQLWRLPIAIATIKDSYHWKVEMEAKRRQRRRRRQDKM